MDYEKEFEKETGYKARYSQGGITRESLKYVNWLKSKCDALQAELLDARTRLDEQRIMTDELKAENERLTNQLDGKYQIMEKQLAIIKERDTELQSLRDEVDNAPSGTVKENNGSLVVFGEYEHASDPELCLKPHRRYKMVEIKGGE